MADDKIKIYDIKIPVYISESLSIESDLFAYTYEEMVQNVKRTINKHNETGRNVASQKRNTTKKKEINSIEYFEHNLGSTPILLIQIDASTTNYKDGYIQREEEVELSSEDKIGSKNYWILLFPRIIGLDPNKYTSHWLIFIYGDPNKDNFDDVTSTAKLFLKRVLGIRYRNVKTTDVLDELKKTGDIISKLQVNYSSVDTNSNDENLKLREYRVSGKILSAAENKYENVPIDETWNFLNDYTYTDEYQKRVVKITQGKKEYKIISGKQLADLSTALEDVVEESFNMTSSVTDKELDSKIIYDENFIIEKMRPIIENYLESYDK